MVVNWGSASGVGVGEGDVVGVKVAAGRGVAVAAGTAVAGGTVAEALGVEVRGGAVAVRSDSGSEGTPQARLDASNAQSTRLRTSAGRLANGFT